MRELRKGRAMTSGNAFIDALVSQSWLDAGRDADVSYAFSNAFLDWSGEEKDQVRYALAQISAVCKVTFTFTSTTRGADIVEYRVTNEQMIAAIDEDYFEGISGWHHAPADVAGTTASAKGYYDFEGLMPQQAGWLVLHELLHAVGLEHPHSDWHGSGLFSGVAESQDAGTFALNSMLTTAMSYRAYNSFAGSIDGPMAFDIAALQHLYGARTSHTGADFYDVGRDGLLCIWDTGGVDWFVSTGSSTATIDLRAATLDLSPLGGGVLSWTAGRTGGLTIANGVIIENARGGSGANTITGNAYANTLIGGGGNDTIRAGSGNDRVIGQLGQDLLTGHGGSDTFIFSTVAESRAAARDVITDFQPGIDHIHVSGIDANVRIAGDQKFAFIGAAPFSGAAGQFHAVPAGKGAFRAEGDINGDRIADFSIIVRTAMLTGEDFLL